MCWTSEGVEPVRVTLVNWDQKRIYDTLVRPQGRVLDYKTRFTGLKNGDLVGVDTTLKDVQADLLELISADTLLLGHSLDYDLRALRLIHENVVDTCVVFPHNRGFPYKSALRKIAKIYLHKTIQDGDGGHDSVEDAATCVQLMLWRVGRDLSEDVLDSADDSSRRTDPGGKLPEWWRVRGPVSYTVQLDNGERHHRHRNQLRSAWTRSESGTGVGCHAGFCPHGKTTTAAVDDPEATQEESLGQHPEESSATRPQQQMTSPEAPEASPEQANQDSTAPRRRTRVRRPVLRYGIND
ncbi:hypothetical protein HPB50_003540 [Hyalomma asiaticum]|uniref:Uncharacterized protein n=1 Tax=Hyalomma asiaticum TaxID=266040 RepID=A0ACB7SN04_HYAAI|nr:hypothetical protein HPB50_003540 [Hyalomma asiaticum]